MKRIIIAFLGIACVAGARGQGFVYFNNRVPGTVITHVYLGGDHQIVGNGSNDYSDSSMTPGTVNWSGYTALLSSNYMGQLLSAPGENQPESTLLPSVPATVFRTSPLAAAGFVRATTATLNNVALDAPSATIEMVAWDNTSGLYPTWTQAEVAWESGLIAAGKGGAFNLYKIGGNILNPAPSLQGLQSFNIFVVPEPTTLALLGLGGAAMALRRRS